MKKLAIGLLASSLAIGPAIAGEHIYMHMHKVKAPIPIQNQGGVGSAPWIVGGIVGCGAVGLIIGAAYVAHTYHREMTQCEANVIVAGCFVPIVGGILVDQYQKQKNLCPR